MQYLNLRLKPSVQGKALLILMQKRESERNFFLITFQLGPKRVKLLVIERDINKLDAPELDEGLLW